MFCFHEIITIHERNLSHGEVDVKKNIYRQENKEGLEDGSWVGGLKLGVKKRDGEEMDLQNKAWVR